MFSFAKMDTRTEFIPSTHFNIGLAVIPGIKDEDCHAIITPETEIAAFGVFDGHGGSFASMNSASKFCSCTFRLLNEMDAKATTTNMRAKFPSITKDDTFDSLFCESVRQSIETMDEDAKYQGSSGTTCLCVFMFRLSDGTTKLYCVNVGDSRCCLIRGGRRSRCTLLSEDHTLSLPREHKRVAHRQTATWWTLPADPRFGFNFNYTFNADISTCYPIPERLCAAERFIWHINRSETRPKSFISRATVDSDDDMSDEGSLQLSEFDLTSSENDSYFMDMTAFDFDFSSDSMEGSIGTYNKYKKSLTTEIAESFTSDSLSPRPVSLAEIGLEAPSAPNIFHSESFITRRRIGSQVGPKVLMSRYNMSTTMTRSIGDKFGPRSCICVPEITVTTIAPDESARILLGTDGVWDMFRRSEQARDLVAGVTDPSQAAEKLATAARRWRETEGKKIDDITMLVVDFNPAVRGAVTGCACCSIS